MQETAKSQIQAMGYSPRDVRHIVLTHLDFDHAGRIEDFPHARVHVMERELESASRHRDGFIARGYVRLLIEQVTVEADQVHIRGSRKALERAVIATAASARGKVPSFAREWRARKDSNLRPPDS